MLDITITKIAESLSEAYLARWYKKNGEYVSTNTPILSLETDKVSLDVVSPTNGILQILIPEGQMVQIGTIVANIEESETDTKTPSNASIPAAQIHVEKHTTLDPVAEKIPAKVDEPMTIQVQDSPNSLQKSLLIAPSALELLQHHRIDISQIRGTGPRNRITKGDVLSYLEKSLFQNTTIASLPKIHDDVLPSNIACLQNGISKLEKISASPIQIESSHTNTTSTDVLAGATETRVETEEWDILQKNRDVPEEKFSKPISPIRNKIAEHLLHAKQNTAMLTTFNEADMTHIIELRQKYNDIFQQKHKITIGYMPFFVKAVVAALQEFPQLNAFWNGKEIIYHNYYHIGIAIGSERGLIVPVLRHADRLNFVEIEQSIQAYVEKSKQNRISLEDLEGGTFTISNGGVYGSLLSTPILHTPQTGILGMHKIQERPIALQGQIVIRPMMYLAMSYDHRMIDGRESVQFLKRIQECLENPSRILIGI